jgi:hypothetical protein
MNNYKIGTQTAQGANLESALQSLGHTGISIRPLWRGISNGKYTVVTDQGRYSPCEWTEKVNLLQG